MIILMMMMRLPWYDGLIAAVAPLCEINLDWNSGRVLPFSLQCNAMQWCTALLLLCTTRHYCPLDYFALFGFPQHCTGLYETFLQCALVSLGGPALIRFSSSRHHVIGSGVSCTASNHLLKRDQLNGFSKRDQLNGFSKKGPVKWVLLVPASC